MEEHGAGVPAWAQTLLQQMKTQNEQQNVRIATLEQSLKEAQSKTPETPATPHALEKTHKRPRSRLPDPSKFNGDRTEWQAWKATMENKLLVDGDAIGNPAERFLYIYSRLEGNAWKNVTTFVTLRRDSGTPESFFDYLERLYGDPNGKTRAAGRLHGLKQGEHQPFSKFLPILEKEFADAGALEWPDDAKRPIILKSLNLQMSQALANRGIPSTFQDIINTLHAISTDMDMLNLQKGSRKTPANSFSMQVAAQAHEEVYHAADAMDWTPSQASRVGKSQVTNPNGYKSGRPEDQALLGKRALWVSKEVLAKRRDEGRCLRCGRDGCLLRRCPLKPALPPSASDGVKPRGSDAKVVRPRVTKAAYVEEDKEGQGDENDLGFSDAESSGKE
jgi:hypothetical protein